MGRKFGGAPPPFWGGGAGSPSNTKSPGPISIASAEMLKPRGQTGLEARLASRPKIWPRPQALGLGLDLGLERLWLRP